MAKPLLLLLLLSPLSLLSLSWSLYRVIKSGSAGREGALAAVCGVEDRFVDAGGGGG